MGNEYENIYGVNFPKPQRVRLMTKQNIYNQIQVELLRIVKEMEKATSYSIQVSKMSSECIDVLAKIGYEITRYQDQNGYTLHYEISWENADE